MLRRLWKMKKTTENKLQNKLIDLVVPMYKNKETLLKLLASIASQSFKNAICVFLVQDCDGEDYTELIKMFKPMLDIELISMEKNSGPGTARRIGMQKGTSPYIMFMDADDTFQNPFAVQELYEYAQTEDYDAVNSVFLEQTTAEMGSFVPHGNNDWVWVFGKIYKRKFLEDNQIYINDSRANEDTGFNTVVSMSGKVGFLPDTTYIWWYKEDSITRTDGGIYRFTGTEGWLYNMGWAIDHLVRLNVDVEKIKKKCASIIIATYCWYLEYLNDSDERVDANKFLEWVKPFVAKYYNEYTPEAKVLLESYQDYLQNKSLAENIPQYTLKDYIKLVGGKEC